MRILIPVISCLLITACATKFDQNNFERMNTLVVSTDDSQLVCADPKTTSDTLNSIKSIAITAMESSFGRKDDDIHTMLVNFVDEIQRFQNIIYKGKISTTYCQNKIKNLNDTARIIEQSEGAKSKS